MNAAISIGTPQRGSLRGGRARSQVLEMRLPDMVSKRLAHDLAQRVGFGGNLGLDVNLYLPITRRAPIPAPGIPDQFRAVCFHRSPAGLGGILAESLSPRIGCIHCPVLGRISFSGASRNAEEKKEYWSVKLPSPVVVALAVDVPALRQR